MQQGYIELNGVPTNVVTFGRWIEEKPSPGDKKDVVIFIPGNPGLTKFSTEFLQTIHEQLECPVWTFSYAGHEPSINKKPADPPLKGNEHLYNLQGQINHKIAFFERYVSPDMRVHLVAHSIGTYMTLKLLKVPEINKKIVKSYLLFPTIEYMSPTENGIFVSRIVRRILWLVFFLGWIVTVLPSFLQMLAIFIYVKVHGVSTTHIKTIVYLLNPQILRQVFFLAFDELETVHERDNDAIRDNINKIKLYYGACDGWVPVSYYHQLKKDIPNVDAELCTRNLFHSFVLNSSREVGLMVSDWIKKTI